MAQRPLEALLQLHAGLLDVDYHVIPVFGSTPHRFSAGARSPVAYFLAGRRLRSNQKVPKGTSETMKPSRVRPQLQASTREALPRAIR